MVGRDADTAFSGGSEDDGVTLPGALGGWWAAGPIDDDDAACPDCASDRRATDGFPTAKTGTGGWSGLAEAGKGKDDENTCDDDDDDDVANDADDDDEVDDVGASPWVGLGGSAPVGGCTRVVRDASSSPTPFPRLSVASTIPR